MYNALNEVPQISQLAATWASQIFWLLVTFGAVFFIVGMTKGDWIEALLFGLSIAVGLTPEMLPMIVTVNLAKGALTMSPRKSKPPR